MTYKIAYAERAAAVTISLITNADCVRQADQVGAQQPMPKPVSYFVMQGNHSQR
jgi:hypothetical protein